MKTQSGELACPRRAKATGLAQRAAPLETERRGGCESPLAMTYFPTPSRVQYRRR